MGTFYPLIKAVHLAAVLASFSWFLLRAGLVLTRLAFAQHWSLRVVSYSIDTVLLTAALMLATILHQYPFVHAWLTMKVLLLVLYLVLAQHGFDPDRSRRQQAVLITAAVLCFGAIYSVARAHHWAGPLAAWFR